ncbi:coenzyme F420-0:L-glutamate ligase [Methanoregula sp.]|jgi:coenzyme F420-0:L-glutamate ligase|uniref:coenzyme F420-0:L-glutamate ligase n=1 Tax=Methanoregula sp. TaxID=2052170 RepID=UPI0025CCAEA0|nr:coenzyme F420-0:L-glutamate ligase [Methanoregula sp.]
MNSSYTVFGLSTGIIKPHDPFADRIIAAATTACGGFKDGDILILAETAVATAEGNIVQLDTVTPSPHAKELAARYHMDPRTVEVVLRESDSVVGGIPGFLLCMKHGTLLPNAGVDASNAPPGCIVPLPADPNKSAIRIRNEIEQQCGIKIGVLVIDSRTHAMRLGCSGVAIGSTGITSVIDDRGRSDLFGRKLEVTKRAVADNIASAAELVMGEADECTPAVIVRGLGMPIGDQVGVDTIDADECLFMGVFRKSRQK